MSKTLRKSLVILIVLVLAILSIPKSESAVSKSMSIGNDTVIYGEWPGGEYSSTIGSLVGQGTGFTMQARSFVLLNKFVFCMEEKQHMPNSFDTFYCNWKITIEDGRVYQQKRGGSKTELTGDAANFTKGLMYILSDTQTGFMNKHDDGAYWLDDYKTKPLQREIWTYLSQASSSIRSSKTGNWYDISFDANETHSGVDVSEAIDIANGNKDCNIKNGEIYLLQTDNNYQKLMIPKTIEIDDTSKLKFKFTKQDSKGNTLTGATVNITISGTKEHDGTKNVSSTGYIELTDMELKEEDGTIEITIQETAAPSGYLVDSTKYYFNIKYNSSEKNWYIDSSNTKTNGTNQLFSGTLSGSTLTTSLINVRKTK